MLTTINEFLNGSGLPISDEISDAKLGYCIKTAEMYLLKPRLGDEMYIAINNDPTTYYEVLNGGIVEKEEHGETKQYYLNGLKSAVFELAFARLLMDNVTATIFGSVIKKDDYSDQIGFDDLYMVAKQHTEVGLQYIDEVCDYLGINNKDRNCPSWTEEFI